MKSAIVHRIRASRWGFPAVLLLLNTVLFAVLAIVLPLAYEENDDVMMCMIANGSYSGTPDCHLVYINVIYGWVLTLLYGLTQAVEWYTLSFAVLHVLSMTVLSYCVLTTPNRARWERVLWLLFLYVLWARIIVALQFTTTAGLVCLAGCMMLLRESKKARWSGVVLVVIAALVRYMAAGLVGVLMAPIIIYTYRTEWRKYMAITVMLAAVAGCRMVNHHVYVGDPDWKYYREYNQLRAQLSDNPNAYQLQPEQLPEGVDEVDYQLLLRFVADPEQIDLPTIRRIYAVVGGVPFRQQIVNLHRLDQYAVEVVILLALLVLMILTTGNRTKYIFLIVYTLFVVALMIHVSLDGFLKNRVFICMLMPILVTDFMLLPKTTGLKRSWGIAIALVALCVWYGYQIADQRLVAHRKHSSWVKLQQPVLTRVPDDAAVITLGTSMRLEAGNPWQVWPYACRKYTLGWMTWLPLNKPIGHSYRILLNDGMYVFTNVDYTEDGSRLELVRRQIEKHYGIRTYVQSVCHNGAHALVQLKIEK